MSISKLKLIILKNKLFRKTHHSKLKLFTVAIFTIILLVGEFVFFLYVFSFLGKIEGIGIVIAEKLFYIFFMAIFFLLIFSNIIVSYSIVYNSKEILILISYPVKYLKIFDLKFSESLLLSSWAFFFITIPFIAAFAAYKNLGVSFLLAGGIYLIPFIGIAGILGNIFVLSLAKFFDRTWFKRLLIILVTLSIPILITKARNAFHTPNFNNTNITFMLNDLIPQLSIANFPLMPSYWLSNGLLSFSWKNYYDSMFYFLFLISNFLMGFLILRLLAKKNYYNIWESIQSFKTSRKHKSNKILNVLDKILSKFNPQKSAFINKDIRLFIRDPIQWSQSLMFFGLLAIYFGNLENLSYNMVPGYWKNTIVFLNLMATSLTLASLCVRFVFPQLSMEGNKAWFLKLAPISFKKILLQKFWVSFIISLIITEGLIFLSNYMLSVDNTIFFFSSIIMALICFALVGISCGLGAIFPNFKKDNPTAIVSGVGGTLNFILSLLYLGLIIYLLAPHVYKYIMAKTIISYNSLIFSIVFIFIISLASGFIPMFLGIKNLNQMEF